MALAAKAAGPIYFGPFVVTTQVSEHRTLSGTVFDGTITAPPVLQADMTDGNRSSFSLPSLMLS